MFQEKSDKYNYIDICNKVKLKKDKAVKHYILFGGMFISYVL